MVILSVGEFRRDPLTGNWVVVGVKKVKAQEAVSALSAPATSI